MEWSCGPGGGADGTVAAVRERIRAAIMTGELQPGAILPQLRLAAEFGVSRTPLREALRMLQEEGLIEIEPNKRARVAGFDAGDLELVYSTRVLLTAVATMLTVPHLTQADDAAMVAMMREMAEFGAAGDAEGWRKSDRAFHRVHCARAPASVRRELDQLFERATLYRLLRLRDEPHRQSVTFHDHDTILIACQARNADGAVRAIVRHLSRIALALLAQMVPEYEPQTLRAALRLALAEKVYPEFDTIPGAG